MRDTSLMVRTFPLEDSPSTAIPWQPFTRLSARDERNYICTPTPMARGGDELVGAGCVDRLEIAYGGAGLFEPTCICFRKAVQEGTLQVEDYSNYQMTLRFMAGAIGVPFLPCRPGLGSDITNRWRFSETRCSSFC